MQREVRSNRGREVLTRISSAVNSSCVWRTESVWLGHLISRIRTYPASGLILLNNQHQDLYPGVWDLQDHTIRSSRVHLLVRLMSAAPQCFYAILSPIFKTETEWSLRYVINRFVPLSSPIPASYRCQAVERLFRMILVITDPTLLAEETRHSAAPIFTQFLRSIWEDKHVCRRTSDDLY